MLTIIESPLFTRLWPDYWSEDERACRWLPKPADSWRIARAIAIGGGEDRSVAGGRRRLGARGKGREYGPAAAWLRLCAGSVPGGA